MRKTMAIVCLLLPACGASPSDPAPSSDEARAVYPSSVVVVDPPPAPSAIASSSSSTSSSSSSSSTSSSSSGSTASPYGTSGGCSFGVAGAIEAWVDNPSTFVSVFPSGEVGMSGQVEGATHGLNFSLGDLDGPGVYVATEASYERYFEVVDQVTGYSYTRMPDVFGATSATCVVTLTEAPVGAIMGAPVVGTFRCEALPQMPSMSDPTQPSGTVMIYEGTLATAVAWPPPD